MDLLEPTLDVQDMVEDFNECQYMQFFSENHGQFPNPRRLDVESSPPNSTTNLGRVSSEASWISQYDMRNASSLVEVAGNEVRMSAIPALADSLDPNLHFSPLSPSASSIKDSGNILQSVNSQNIKSSLPSNKNSKDDPEAENDEELASRISEVVRLRNKTLGQRMDVLNERRHYINQIRFTLEAQERFEQLYGTIPATGTITYEGDGASYGILQAIHASLEQVQNSNILLKQLVKGLQQQEQRLLRQDEKLVRKERFIYKKLQGQKKANGSPAMTSHQASHFESSTSFSSEIPQSVSGYDTNDSPALSFQDHVAISSEQAISSIETIPTIRNYYSLIGNSKILQERFHNFESEHRRQQRLRESHKQDGKVVDPPDAQFYQQYFDGKLKFLREYSKAKADARELREICDRKGYEVADPKVPLMGFGNVLDRSSSASGFENLYSISFAAIQKSQSLARDQVLPFFLPEVELRYRVLTWLEKVECTPGEKFGFPSYYLDRKDESLSDTKVDNIIYPPDDGNLDTASGRSSLSSEKHIGQFYPDRPQRRLSDPNVLFRRTALQEKRLRDMSTSRSTQ